MKNIEIYLSFVLFLISFNLAATTRFLVFGDFGTNDENQSLVARDMEQYCQKKGCDFAVTVGDNIYPSGVQNLYEGEVNFDKGSPNYKIITDYFVNYYKALKMPFYMSFGNHDISIEGSISTFKDMLQNQESIAKHTFNLMRNQINYTNNADNPMVTNSKGQVSRMWNFKAPFYHEKEKDNVNLFAIDTNSFPHRVLNHNKEFKLALSKNFEQSNWLKEELLKTKGWKIVFGHMPLLSHGIHGLEDAEDIKDFRDSIVNLLCEQRVDFYFSGHDHQLEVDRYRCPNGHVIVSVISGAAADFDQIYDGTFPKLSTDKNLIWANGKLYNSDKSIYKSDDKVLGFAHITIDGSKALLKMKLSKNASHQRKSACFEVTKGEGIKIVACPKICAKI